MSMSCRAEYDEVRKLGEGSYGAVSLVRRRKCTNLYVVRQYNTTAIRNEFSDDPNVAAFLTKRVRAQPGLMMSLQHSNILRIMGSFEEKITGQEVVHIIFEYCNDGDLESAINENKPFTEMQLCSWAKQLVMALQFLHNHGIAHRRVTTNNIFFLGERRFVKLGEFGCSETLHHLGKVDREELLPYCPPEVLTHHKFSRKGDVWMLGVILYRLATFKFPFFEHEARNFKDHVINGTPVPIPKRFSSEIRDIVRSLLRKNPIERPTVAQLLGDSPFLNRPIANEGYLDLGLERIKSSDLPEQHKSAICSIMQAQMVSADMLSQMPDEQIKTMFQEIGLQIAVQAWKEEDASSSKPIRLLKAAESGDVELVRRFLNVFGARKLFSQDETIWQEAFDGETPLIRAAKYGQLEIVELLLSDEVGAPIDARNNAGNCAIHEAITNNHVRIVDVMLIHDPRLLEAYGEYGWTPIMRAAAFGHLDCVQLLLRKCANPTAVGNQDCEDTAIHLAAYFGRGEVVQYMLNVLPNLIDRKNVVNATPLFRAAAGGHADVVNLIISQGAEVDPCATITPLNSTDSFCYSPLHEAAAYGHLDAVKLFVKYGADVNRRSRSVGTRGLGLGKKAGSLPIHFAAEQGHLSVVQYFLTLNSNFLEAKNSRGRSLLSLAAGNGHLRLVKFLVERKADTESTDHLNKTPLIYAASHGHIEVLKLLLKHGANIYARSNRATPGSSISPQSGDHPSSLKKNRSTVPSESSGDPQAPAPSLASISKTSMAIHLAAEHLQFEIVQYLLEFNDSLLEIKDSQGKSPLACAISANSRALPLITYLLSKRASTETRDVRGWTPLHQAAHVGAVEIVELLLRQNANVYALTNTGDMPIHLAVVGNKISVIKFLLDERPDLFGAKNKRENTPFRQAMLDKSSHSDVVRFLKNWDASFCSVQSC